MDNLTVDLEARLARARRSLDGLCRALDEKARALDVGGAEALDRPEVERAVRDVQRALVVALDAERKVADARAEERGGDGIDLAAAGAEVRRRLDRLRDARSSGGVLEQSE